MSLLSRRRSSSSLRDYIEDVDYSSAEGKEIAKAIKIRDIKAASLKSVMETELFDDIKNSLKEIFDVDITFSNFDRNFRSTPVAKTIQMYVKDTKGNNEILTLQFSLDKDDFSDIFNFKKQIEAKIFSNIAEFYDFFSKSELQKYWILTSSYMRKFYNAMTQAQESESVHLKSLQEIELFDKVAIIGTMIFSMKTFDIDAIVIPSNIKIIEQKAFFNVNFIKNIFIPKSVKRIGQNAFKNCKNLCKVEFEDLSDITIEENAFLNCNINNLELPNLVVEEGIVFNEDKSEILYCARQIEEYFVSTSVKKIHKNAFEIDSLKKISISKNTECDGKCVTEGIFVELRGDDENVELTFESTSTLSQQYVKKWMKKNPKKSPSEMEILKTNWIYEIKSGTFERIENLYTLTIPRSVKKIDSAAIYACPNLSEVIFLNKETKLSNYNYGYSMNFRSCNIMNLEQPDLKIANGLIIDKGSDEHSKITLQACTISSKEVVIPEGVEVIANSAFCENKAEIIKLPSTLITIKENAFDSCKNLKKIIIPKSVKEIEDDAFANCTKLEEFILENEENLVLIGSSILQNTAIKNLKSKYQNLTIIDGLCFNYYDATLGKSIKYAAGVSGNLIIPDDVTDIDENAFMGCHKLQSVVFPKKLRSILNSAFYGCFNLEKIDFEKCNGLQEIGLMVFGYCKIHEFESEFLTIKNGFCIYEPDDFHEYYHRSELTSINYIADSTMTKEITIPEGIENLMLSMFLNIEELEILNLPHSIKKIHKLPRYFNDYDFSNLQINYDGSEEDWKKIIMYSSVRKAFSGKVKFKQK